MFSIKILNSKVTLKVLEKYLIISFCIFTITLLIIHFVLYDIASIILLVLLFPVLLVMLIVGLIKARKNKKYTLIILVVLTIPILVLSFFTNFKLMNYEGNLTEANGGKQLVDALEQYYTHNYAYPVHLSQLVPKYIEEVPQTSMLQGDKDFEYYKTSDGDYILNYYYGFTMMQYSNVYNCWCRCPKG